MVRPEIRAGYRAIAAYNPAQPLLTLPFTTPVIIHRRLAFLKGSGMSYPQISALAEFSEIPPGTLQAMYTSTDYYVPEIHKRFLRCRPDRPRNRASINLDNMESAAQTIVNYLGDDIVKLYNLIDILDHKFTEILKNK